MIKLLKRLFCKHDYKTLTNLYGDVVREYNGAKSIQICTKCGKRIYCSCIDPECRKVNNI